MGSSKPPPSRVDKNSENPKHFNDPQRFLYPAKAGLNAHFGHGFVDFGQILTWFAGHFLRLCQAQAISQRLKSSVSAAPWAGGAPPCGGGAPARPLRLPMYNPRRAPRRALDDREGRTAMRPIYWATFSPAFCRSSSSIFCGHGGMSSSAPSCLPQRPAEAAIHAFCPGRLHSASCARR